MPAMKSLICLLATGLAAGLATGLATGLAMGPALGAGDPEKAKGLIAETCAQCHPVPGYESDASAAMLEAPSFPALARAPGTYTPERMTEFLAQPHWPMRSIVLSRRDIENLLAFIAALRPD